MSTIESQGPKISFRTVVIIGFIISIPVYLSTFAKWEYGDLREPVRGLAEAGFIAMTLAVTVDLYLKTELARDAINLALGYVLPGYLKDEMVAIYSNALICVEHTQVLTLSKLSDEELCVTLFVRRELQNISTTYHSVKPELVVDEWLMNNHRSIIREFGYKSGDQEEQIVEPANGTPLKGDIPQITVPLKETMVPPNGSITIWWKTDEFKHINDVHVSSFRYSTHEPSVRIDAPDDIGWIVEFPHRLDEQQKKTGDTVVLPALLLPHQSILVRWWNDAAAKKWREERAAIGPR
jgi:hypothetical protein